MSPKETKARIDEGMKCFRDLREHWLSILDPVNILIVDDDRNFCSLLTSCLERILERRCVVNQAFSGRQALTILSSNKIDLLFLDLRMPGGHGNGLDVLKSLPTDLGNMIVLPVTGIVGESEELLEARQLGYKTIIHKSELWDDLRTVFGLSCISPNTQ